MLDISWTVTKNTKLIYPVHQIGSAMLNYGKPSEIWDLLITISRELETWFISDSVNAPKLFYLIIDISKLKCTCYGTKKGVYRIGALAKRLLGKTYEMHWSKCDEQCYMSYYTLGLPLSWIFSISTNYRLLGACKCHQAHVTEEFKCGFFYRTDWDCEVGTWGPNSQFWHRNPS